MTIEQNLIEVKNLYKSFGKIEVLKEINAEITDKRNEFGLTTGGKGH